MKKLLIIGGNGYIGSRMYEYLLSQGYTIDNVDLCWFGKVFDETIVEDYRNLPKEMIQQYTHIILLAGHSSVSMCSYNFLSAYKNNVSNFIDIIEKITDEQTLIYSTTCAVYGNNSKLMDENDQIKDSSNYYDFTKVTRENIAKLYPNKKLIGLRFGTVGGFSKNYRIENLMNALTLSSLNKSLIVSNGESMRSVLGITDSYLVMQKLIEAKTINHRIYNITSFNDKIINVANTIKDLTGSKIIINETLKTDYSFNCSNSLFEQEFDFKFTSTIKSIYEDIIENLDRIQYKNPRKTIIYA
jgi:nucleoside-diphosphate-sugar epimerase